VSITIVPTEKNEIVPMRGVNVKGTFYLHPSDVAAYIRKMAETETTDVRHRLNAAADSISNPRPL
jgi:hypothetical protein